MNQQVFEQARLSRDARFDGRFFTALKTTGIYCRPICPVKAPKSRNVQFFTTACAFAPEFEPNTVYICTPNCPGCSGQVV